MTTQHEPHRSSKRSIMGSSRNRMNLVWLLVAAVALALALIGIAQGAAAWTVLPPLILGAWAILDIRPR